MASIKEETRDGHLTCYRFRACLGRDKTGRQVRVSMTWEPPPGLSRTRARKAAEKAAAEWEAQQRALYDQVQQEQARLKREDITFADFVRGVWLPLAVEDGQHRAATVTVYKALLQNILPYFDRMKLRQIDAVEISRYLTWLRTEYRTPAGEPLAEYSIKHHYDIVRMVFRYAERHDYILIDPCRKVDSPRMSRHQVDALTPEQAEQFFRALQDCNLETRAIMLLMATAGLRRGEVVGLRWGDVDLDNGLLHIRRSVTYTPMSGVEIHQPKTASSVRTVPVIQATRACLWELYRQRRKEWRGKDVGNCFLFCSQDDPMQPRHPDNLTGLVKRFMAAAGLPDLSPHDLRHSCASLLLAAGADVKAVQEILGHTSARTTLDYYVRADLNQQRQAADRFAAAYGLNDK